MTYFFSSLHSNTELCLQDLPLTNIILVNSLKSGVLQTQNFYSSAHSDKMHFSGGRITMTKLLKVIYKPECQLVNLWEQYFPRRYVYVQLFSFVWLFATLCTVAHQAPLSMRFFRQEYWSGVDCHFLLQGIFLTQWSNKCFLCLLHCREDSLPA